MYYLNHKEDFGTCACCGATDLTDKVWSRAQHPQDPLNPPVHYVQFGMCPAHEAVLDYYIETPTPEDEEQFYDQLERRVKADYIENPDVLDGKLYEWAVSRA